MKINFEVDMTPEELRRLCGLPDMTKLQDKMIEQMSERMKNADVETMKNMMKPFIFDGIKAGADGYQSFLSNMLKMATMGKVKFGSEEFEEELEKEFAEEKKPARKKPASKRKASSKNG